MTEQKDIKSAWERAGKSLSEGSGNGTQRVVMWSASLAMCYGTIPILSKGRWQPDVSAAVPKETGKCFSFKGQLIH